jgi:hypothetical protein
MPNTPKGLSDEKAGRVMTALRAGETPRKFAVKPCRFEAYLQAHPEYAVEARPLIEANAVAGATSEMCEKTRADALQIRPSIVWRQPLRAIQRDKAMPDLPTSPRAAR